MADPRAGLYLQGWGRTGDLAVIGEDEHGRRLGAAWARHFSATAPSWGFVSEDVPELAIAVVADARGQGIGSALLAALVDAARAAGEEALSLEVDSLNTVALQTDRSAGFMRIGGTEAASTMILIHDASHPVVRSFGWPDYEAVVALWRETGFPIGPSESHDGIALKLQREPELFLVAEVDGLIVGAVLAGFDRRRGWIYHLTVTPERRREGFGSALLREAERRMRATGCVKVNLLVRPNSGDVVGFYEQLGYQRDEHIFMEKWLEPPG